MSAIHRIQPGFYMLHSSPLARMRAIPAAMFGWLAAAMRRRRRRTELARLDDRLLRDIGLTRDDVMRGGRKPR